MGVIPLAFGVGFPYKKIKATMIGIPPAESRRTGLSACWIRSQHVAIDMHELNKTSLSPALR